MHSDRNGSSSYTYILTISHTYIQTYTTHSPCQNNNKIVLNTSISSTTTTAKKMLRGHQQQGEYQHHI